MSKEKVLDFPVTDSQCACCGGLYRCYAWDEDLVQTGLCPECYVDRDRRKVTLRVPERPDRMWLVITFLGACTFWLILAVFFWGGSPWPK